MPSFYEDLYMRLRKKGLTQMWQRTKAIALVARIFCLPVNQAAEACDNWLIDNPEDREWESLKRFIEQGLVEYRRDGKFYLKTECEVRFYSVGQAQELIEIEPNDRFYCGWIMIDCEDRLAKESTESTVRACQTCAYYYAYGSDRVCNAFHTEFNSNTCGDWQKK